AAELPALGCGLLAGQEQDRVPLCQECLDLLLAAGRRSACCSAPSPRELIRFRAKRQRGGRHPRWRSNFPPAPVACSLPLRRLDWLTSSQDNSQMVLNAE